MDIEMPVMNGLKAAKIIRKTVRYFPIIATSANHDYRHDCSAVGIDDFIETPYDSDTLYEKLNELNVKQFIFHFQDDQLIVKKETPMDQQHAKEIRQLKENGLVKVRFGTNGEDLILHKFATNKISHDFISKGHMISVFLNHDPDKPTRCELYQQHCHITQTYLDDVNYSAASQEEKEEMEKYSERTVKPEKEGNSATK